MSGVNVLIMRDDIPFVKALCASECGRIFFIYVEEKSAFACLIDLI